MAIQNRRGFYDKFDPSRLVAGEWAIVLDGDKNAPDGKSAYVCFAAGTVKRVALFEDMSTNIKKANKELVEELTAATNSATQKASETTEKCENTIKTSEETIAATTAAKEDCIQATQACKISTERSQSATQETKDATNACNAATSESKASIQIASETLEKLNTSENARIDAEKVRVENENTRVSNEQKRVSDESERASAEQTRKSNEDERLTHESTRVDAEKVRVEAETTRLENEKVRTSTEQTRVQTETERINNEKMRVESENTRKNEEETRSNNEKVRIEKETNRLIDEEKRASAEKERAEKENVRISAEETRVSNESARVDEENSRKLRFKEMIDAAQNVKFKVLEDNQVSEKGVPTIEGTAGVIYLVKDKKSTDTNSYIEWFYYNNKWEVFGTTNASMEAIPVEVINKLIINNEQIEPVTNRVLNEVGCKILTKRIHQCLRYIEFFNNNHAKKTDLATKADKTDVEQLKKDKADKTDVDQLKENKADKSELNDKADKRALKTLDENKADKETVEQLKKDKADKTELTTSEQKIKNYYDVKINKLEKYIEELTKKNNKVLKLVRTDLPNDGFVYIIIEHDFVKIRMYIAKRKKCSFFIPSSTSDYIMRIVDNQYKILYNLLKPKNNKQIGIVSYVNFSTNKLAYNSFCDDYNILWRLYGDLVMDDAMYCTITYPRFNDNAIDEKTLNSVNEELNLIKKQTDSLCVSGTRAYLI